MSQTIRILDEKTINQIAAGEVIENASSVIKELVDNAIDAKATYIQITVRASGRQAIVVQDNGFGMTKEDLLICLERHATSKLETETDLWKLSTMGFRGEALSAISSVSRLSILTCQHDAAEKKSPVGQGHFLKAEGSKILSCSPAQGLFGTKVEVEDLFYNTPARRKFLHSVQKEEKDIFKTVMLLALSRADIGFELIINGKKELSVDPTTHEGRMKELLGAKAYCEHVVVSFENEWARIHGFIAKPTYSKPNRLNQFLFINHRPITSFQVSQWIKEGYGSSIEETRHPSFVLHLELQKDLVDVNVHPQKKEVRFAQEFDLRNSCIQLVRKALFSAPARTCDLSSDLPCDLLEKPVFSTSYQYTPCQKPLQVFVEEQKLPKNEQTFELFQIETPSLIAVFDPYVLARAAFLPNMPVELEKEGLLFIHSHLALARIAFEESLKNEQSLQSQQLLVPHFIEMSAHKAHAVRGCLEKLVQEGVQIREFGENAFLIEALPPYLDNIDLDEFLQYVVVSHDEKNTFFERKQAFMKQALRFSKKCTLGMEFAEILVKKLFACDDPYHCPNGKKTMFTLNHEILSQYG